ncbi:MAG TPA: 4Fe-4S binding protein [Spirochaetia bacterium]|nr:4Fe-4S binding protein [Spirochaetia bacterium]
MASRKTAKSRKAEKKVTYPSAAAMPPMAVSSFDMSYNHTGTWRSLKPKIDYEKCIYCLICWKFCPEPAISLDSVVVKGKEKEKPVINYTYCKGCGICWTECPVEAIEALEEQR